MTQLVQHASVSAARPWVVPSLPTESESVPMNPELQQERALRRIARRALRSAEPLPDIVFEYTEDPAMLHQFYEIRKQMYRVLWNFDYTALWNQELENLSRIYVIRRNKQCLGGFRLTIREPGEQFMLPMETKEFNLRSELPAYDLGSKAHAEISALTLLDEFNTPEVLTFMAKNMLRAIMATEIEYAFCRADKKFARLWKRVSTKFSELKVTEVEGIRPPSIKEISSLADVNFILMMFERSGVLSKINSLVFRSENSEMA